MKLIELHILQSFPVTCLNRDELGSPKSAVFGGVNRARVSSQCLKRCQRLLFKQFEPEFAQGVRSRLLGRAYFDILSSQYPELLDSHPELPELLSELWGKVEKPKGELPKAKTMTFFSPAEMQALVEKANAFYQDAPKGTEQDLKKELKKVQKAFKVKDAADIALFGRMIADDASLNVEGAAMFSHALSTHRSEPDFDYYTAVDDLQENDDSGAGMVGVLEFNSACYYRYIGLNVDLLKQNIPGLEQAELQGIVSAFIRSALMAVPSARRNSMNGATLPGYVLGLVREGHPLQLVNAFEKPVKSTEGYLKKSEDALKTELDNMVKTWDISVPVQSEMPSDNIENFINTLTADL